MSDAFAAAMAALADDQEIRAMLDEVCAVTGMGFAAVACVTDDRWIACQVEDRIEFGLDSGDELNVKQTICSEVRDCGQAIIIDDVTADPHWRSHPVPVIYGFKSYASLPVLLADGSFFGTLCAIDPQPRQLSTAETVAMLQAYAARVGAILSERAGVAAAAD